MHLRLVAELGPVLAAVLLAWFFPAIPASLWSLPSRALRQFARSRRQAIVWSAVLSFAVCPIFSWVRPPSPTIHDEFSYLLASDTFAHGRLTNPPHPLWEHFESFHINHQPTYQSKYPPGQGLFLALGQALTGRPIVGVWLSVAAAAAAVCWMLLAWMPPRWALFGALLPAFRFGTLPLWDYFWFAYWNTTFWGGAVAMAGGALLLGALPRLVRKPRALDAVLLALGLLVLANTRPFEGLVAALPVAMVLTAATISKWRAWKTWAAQLAAPAAGVLLIGALAMGYYNFRGTGDPWKMPYMVHTEQYEVAPLFIFQPPGPGKTYHHEVFRDYQYEFMMNGYHKKKSGFFFSQRDLDLVLRFFWGYVLWAPLLFLLMRPRSLWTAFAAALIALSLLANTLSSSERLHLHYLAPVAPMFVFLAVAGLRRMRVLSFGTRRVGRAAAEAIVLVSLLSFTAACAIRAMNEPPYPTPLAHDRPLITRQLEATAGKDLVIVNYRPGHDFLWEWVYNGADLENAPILWARDMGPEKNRKLTEYYSTRKAWLLQPDENPLRLQPYETPPIE